MMTTQKTLLNRMTMKERETRNPMRYMTEKKKRGRMELMKIARMTMNFTRQFVQT